MVLDAQDQGWRKGPWTPDEDKLLSEYVNLHGEGRWSSVARNSGLNRNGKSCRLRWVNYLRPGLKRGHLSPQEEAFIIELHGLWGNKWSTIARYLPGRTDNEIKNFWRTHFKKKERSSQKQRKSKPQFLKRNQQREDHQKQQKEDNYNQKNSNLPDEESPNSVQTNEEKPRGRDDEPIVFTYPTMEDQLFSMMYQDFEDWPDAAAAEDSLWGGLWNLDDPVESKAADNFLRGGFRLL